MGGFLSSVSWGTVSHRELGIKITQNWALPPGESLEPARSLSVLSILSVCLAPRRGTSTGLRSPPGASWNDAGIALCRRAETAVLRALCKTVVDTAGAQGQTRIGTPPFESMWMKSDFKEGLLHPSLILCPRM